MSVDPKFRQRDGGAVTAEATGDQRVRFFAELGAAMVSANYPINVVRLTLQRAAEAYGVEHTFVALPTYVQVGTPVTVDGPAVHVARSEGDVRYDQTFPLAGLVQQVEKADIGIAEAATELERILAAPTPRSPGARVFAYVLQSAGLGLLLMPTPPALLGAVVFGLLVGCLRVGFRRSDAMQQLLPTVCAFLVTLIAFTVGVRLGLEHHDSIRALAPALATFLPGSAITLAVIELSTRETISGASRLVSGLIQLAQLALGILVAAQVAGFDGWQLSSVQLNQLGPWAPWLGVAVYGFGTWMYLGPARSFLPWLLLMCFTAYVGQYIGHNLLGSYAGGFCGGVVLTIVALIVSQRPGAPPAVTLIMPGFWLMVPGTLGLVGVTQLFDASGAGAFSATIVSIISIGIGIQAGLLVSMSVRSALDRRWW